MSVTTAGLSVVPDDVTRQGLTDAGAEDMIYGAPMPPGAMLLLTRIGIEILNASYTRFQEGKVKSDGK